MEIIVQDYIFCQYKLAGRIKTASITAFNCDSQIDNKITITGRGNIASQPNFAGHIDLEALRIAQLNEAKRYR